MDNNTLENKDQELNSDPTPANDEHHHAAGSMPAEAKPEKSQEEADNEKNEGKHGLHPSQPEGEMHDRVTGEDMKDKEPAEGEDAGAEGEGDAEGDPDMPPADAE